MLLIGSLALKYHYDNYFSFTNDIDLIGTEEEFQEWMTHINLSEKPKKTIFENLTVYNFKFNDTNYEFEVANNNSAEDYLKYCNVKDGDFEIASEEVLYSIKKSHIHKALNFKKHIYDYHFLKKQNIDDSKLEEITNKRKIETDIRLKLRYPNLNQNYNEFMSESQTILDRIYDHDDIHRIVAHYEKPLFKSLQINNGKVWCDEKLWTVLKHEDKIKCVLEELYVITLERKIIPMIFQAKQLITNEKAVQWSLIKMSTSLTNGWFRNFILDNYYNILKSVKYDFIDSFFEELDKGKVKHYINKVYK